MNVIERSKLKDSKFSRRRRNPSFSSSLLDTIYRSIDESKVHEEDLSYYIEPRKKQSTNSSSNLDFLFKEEKKTTNLGRAIMIENWLERESIRSSSLLSNSGSGSSESSSGAAWSSSETESSYKQRSEPKQLRTEVSVFTQKFEDSGLDKQPKLKHENGISLTKTKLKAQKIYGELKKMKQPISPGSRISSFINFIFNSGNVKKSKMCYVGAVEDVNSENVSKSTATSSRSCLSKSNTTSCSRTKKSNDVKRSVGFYPVSLILGEDDSSLMPLPTIQNFVRSFSENKDCSFNNNALCDDEDDLGSDSSSDLFEIDHLLGINGRYREELAVYETTNMKTNQAIANGFIL